MKKLRFISTKKFLGTVVILVIIFVSMHTVVQQALRLSANDPQIQMAEDAATALNRGQAPDTIIGSQKVDLGTSLAPAIVIYGSDQKALAGNGYFQGSLPTLPAGLLDYVHAHGQDRFTWQPSSGVRQAAVVTPYDHGYVLATRSLREVEVREHQSLALAFVGGILSLVGLLLISL
jgi:hypothetical protein